VGRGRFKLWRRSKPRSKWQRGAFLLTFASLFAQGIIAASALILSRLYSPTEFGTFTVSASILAIFTIIAALRYDLAVVLPNGEEEAYAVTYAGLISTVLVSLLALVTVLAVGKSLADFLDLPDLWPWLLVIPPAVLAGGTFLCLSQLALRRQLFSTIATRNVIQATGGVGAQVWFGLGGITSGGLIAGQAIGQTLGSTTLLFKSGFDSSTARAARNWSSIRDAAKRYRKFPQHMTFAALLNVAGLQLPVLLFAYYYGAEVTGWFGLTQRVLILPAAVIGTAVMQVFRSKASVLLREDRQEIHPLYRRTSWRLLKLSLIPVIVIWVAGPTIFELGLGEQWRQSGQFARILSLVFVAQLVVVPVSSMLGMLERTAQQLSWDIGRFTMCSLGVWVPALLGAGDEVTLWVYSCTSGLAYLALWLIADSACRNTALDV
jgi:O-antigen/teichoic acid export membrane protein